MKKMVFAVALLGTLIVHAAGNPDNTMGEKAALCVACHGQQGISLNPEWPNIAGQHASYLRKQLQDFKQGKTRSAPTMAAMVSTMSEEDMGMLAAFYANQPVAEGSTPEKYLKRGEQLYRGGDFKKKITACIACHGPKGTGNAQAGFPALSGQHAPYTIQQLQLFKTHKRSNDLNAIMQDISARMSKKDMAAVAYYIQGLH